MVHFSNASPSFSTAMCSVWIPIRTVGTPDRFRIALACENIFPAKIMGIRQGIICSLIIGNPGSRWRTTVAIVALFVVAIGTGRCCGFQVREPTFAANLHIHLLRTMEVYEVDSETVAQGKVIGGEDQGKTYQRLEMELDRYWKCVAICKAAKITIIHSIVPPQHSRHFRLLTALFSMARFLCSSNH